MKKSVFISVAMLFLAAIAEAQLTVNTDSIVRIGTNIIDCNPLLMVGYNSFFGSNNISVGTAAAPKVLNQNNIAVLGSYSANTSNSSDNNFGVLGIVDNMNNTHGRFYGLCGMINNSGNCYGGAGIYGTEYDYYLSNPINISGKYAAYFAGHVYMSTLMTTTSMFIPTDIRLCSNMTSMSKKKDSGEKTLENLLNINVVKYNMKSRLDEKLPKDITPEKAELLREEFKHLEKEDEELTSRSHFGIVGQELQKIYPNLVLKGHDGYLSVNYLEMVPLLIRSIQELQQEINMMKGETEFRTRGIADEGKADKAPVRPTMNVLYQNSPNPFQEQTVIRFTLAEDAKDAAICIFDLNGKMLKKLPITPGMTSVSVGGYELGEGMFLYTLIIDGQEIDTKKMIII